MQPWAWSSSSTASTRVVRFAIEGLSAPRIDDVRRRRTCPLAARQRARGTSVAAGAPRSQSSFQVGQLRSYSVRAAIGENRHVTELLAAIIRYGVAFVGVAVF